MVARKAPYSSLEKTVKILKSFIPNNNEKGTGEISREMGLHVSTVSRQLTFLADHGFLHLNPRTKKYSLGKTCLDLGWAVRQTIRDNFVIIAKPYIDELRDKLGADIAMEVMFGKSTIIAYRAWGPQINKTRFTMDDTVPVHIAAGARAIMAFSPIRTVDNLLKGKLTRMTPRTITNVKLLKEKLLEFKREGVAYDIGESDPNCQFVGAPIFDYGKNALAAIVFGRIFDEGKEGFDPKEIRLLKETAKKISHQLYY